MSACAFDQLTSSLAFQVTDDAVSNTAMAHQRMEDIYASVLKVDMLEDCEALVRWHQSHIHRDICVWNQLGPAA